jgi:outer membrane translocation and assembly module TamA
VAGVDQADPVRHSAGLGLRVATPVGPFNLQIGFKLDRKKDQGPDKNLSEPPFRIHFSIGTF